MATVAVCCLFQWEDEDSYSELEIASGNPWWVRSIWRNQSSQATVQYSVPFTLCFQPQQELRISFWVKGRGKRSPQPKLISKTVPLPQCTTRERSQRTELGKEEAGKWSTTGKNPTKGQREWKWMPSGEGVLSSKKMKANECGKVFKSNLGQT